MKILVTGASGFVGKALMSALKLQGVNIVATGRTPIELFTDTCIVVADGLAPNAWNQALQGCDVVVHLAGRAHILKELAEDPVKEFQLSNVDLTKNLAEEAVRQAVKRFVFVSSIGVHGDHTLNGDKFTQSSLLKPHNAYTQSKLNAELVLQDIAERSAMELVIIRPPLVYGAGVKANFKNMLLAVKQSLPLPLGAIYNKRSFVYVENLVSLIMLCIDHPAAANQTFLVSDGQDLSTTELLRLSAAALGVKSRLLPVPQKIVQTCAVLLGKRALAQRLCGNLQVDMTKTQDLLGWQPPFTVEEGLRATALELNKLNSK